jgi:hypothetical protein
MNTTTAINTSNRYTIEATLQEQGHNALAQVFREMCNQAEFVNDKLVQMERVATDNKARWENMDMLFYGATTVRNAASFEQAYAKYESLALMFSGLCNMAGIDNTVRAEMYIVSRGAK